MSALSLHAYAKLKRMQNPSPVDPARQDLGIFLDIADGSTATGSLGSHGPGSSNDSRNYETQTWYVLKPPKMNKHKVPFYHGSLANNTTKGLRSGSIIIQHASTTNLSEFIAKQVLCRSGLFLKQEPNVTTLLLDIKMMVSPMQLTVPSAAPMQISLSANPNQLKTERLENNLRFCGKNWLTNLKFSSLVEMTKVHSSSQRSILARMFSASKIEETGLENLCSNLLPLEADKLLPLLHLSCLFLGVPPEVL